jgi:hypothetical protein
MKNHIVLFFVFVCLAVGCHRHTSSQSSSIDGGVTPKKIPGSVVTTSPNVGSVTTVTNRINKVKKYLQTHPSPNMMTVKGGPADPRIVECAKVKTWKDFETCSEPIKNPPKPKAGLFGTGNPPIICPAQAIPVWYFDPSGNINNSCTTALAPCPNDNTGPLTVESRWGCGSGLTRDPVISQATAFHIPASGMTSNSNFTIRPIITVPNGSFTIIGTPTTVGTGTLSGVVAKNNLAGQPLTINLTSASSHKNQLLTNTTRNASSWVDDSISTNVARLTQPLNTSNLEVDSYTNGDSYTLQTMPNIYIDEFAPTCAIEPSLFQVGVPPCDTRAVLTFVTIPNVTIAPATYQSSQLREVALQNTYIASQTDMKSVWAMNSVIGFQPYNFQNSGLLGGSGINMNITALYDQFGFWVGSDAYLHSTVVVPPNNVGGGDAFWVDPGQEMFLDGGWFPDNLIPGDGVVETMSNLNPSAGNFVIHNEFSGLFAYNGNAISPTAAQSFSPGIVLETDIGQFAYALGAAEQHDVVRGPRALSIPALDTPTISGGFDGLALNASLSGGYRNWAYQAPPQVPFSAQPFTAIGASPEILDLSLWLRSDYSTINAGNLIYLRDESGNGYNYNSFGGTNITYTTPPWLHFDGGGYITQTGTPLLLGDHSTIFVVVRSSGTVQGTIWADSNVIVLGNLAGGPTWGTYVGAYLDSGVNVNDGLPHVLCIRTHTVSNIDLITDGAMTNYTNGTSYGTYSPALGYPLGWVGDVAEVDAFSADLTNQQVDYEDQYLSGRYGVPISTSSPCTTLTGDVRGTTCANTVTAIQSTHVSTVTPTINQILEYSTVTSPSGIPGIQLWLNWAHTVLSGANVTTWIDLSANANSAAGAGPFPTYVSSGGPGGSGYINFNGTQTLSSTTSVFPSGHDRTIFAIGSTTNHPTNNLITFRLSAPIDGIYFSSPPSTQYVYSDNATVSNTVGVPDFGTPHLFQWGYHVGSTTTFSIDGTPIAVAGGAATSDTGSPGYKLATDPAAEFGIWQIEDILAVDHITSAYENSIMGGYAQITYGITVAGAAVNGYSPVYYHSPTVSTSWTPGTITAASAATTTVTFAGATLGQVAAASFSSALPTGAILTAQVTAANTITVTIGNLSATPIVIGAGSVYVSLP